jgi:hypothetical protein
MTVTVQGSPDMLPDVLEFTCYDANGSEVRFLHTPEPPRLGSGGRRRYEERERRHAAAERD